MKLPATGPYVDRILRIFRDRPHDDGTALVLQDYARAALLMGNQQDHSNHPDTDAGDPFNPQGSGPAPIEPREKRS